MQQQISSNESDSALLPELPGGGGPGPSAETSCSGGFAGAPAPVAVAAPAAHRLMSEFDPSPVQAVLTVHCRSPLRPQHSPARACMAVGCYVTAVTLEPRRSGHGVSVSLR